MSTVAVSVCWEDRRVDASVPALVPVAELVPGLLELLDPAGRAGVLRLTTLTGSVLDPARGLTDQGIADGQLLRLADLSQPAPVLHDDLAEAVASVASDLAHPRPWGRHVGQTLTAAGSLALLLTLVPERALTWLLRDEVARVVAITVAVLVVAGTAAPRLALAVAGVRVPWPDEDTSAVETEQLARDLAWAQRIVVVLTSTVGVLPGLVAPVVVRLGPAATVLSIVCVLLVLLRTRNHRSGRVVEAGLATGVASLVSVSACTLVVHESWRPAVAVALFVPGLALLARPPGSSYRLRRAADLLETGCLVAVPPLLLLVSGLLDRLPGA